MCRIAIAARQRQLIRRSLAQNAVNAQIIKARRRLRKSFPAVADRCEITQVGVDRFYVRFPGNPIPVAMGWAGNLIAKGARA